MKTGFFLAVLFLFFLGIEYSGFHAFGGVVAHIPLMILAGILVTQRLGPLEGALWFVVLGVVSKSLFMLFLACAVPLLVIHLFTTRSVYALLGLGAVSWCISALSLVIFGGVVDGLQGLLLLPSLFVGVFVVRFFERVVFSKVSFRSSL